MTYHKTQKKRENVSEIGLVDISDYKYDNFLFKNERRTDEIPTKKEKKRRDKDFNNFNNFF